MAGYTLHHQALSPDDKNRTIPHPARDSVIDRSFMLEATSIKQGIELLLPSSTLSMHVVRNHLFQARGCLGQFGVGGPGEPYTFSPRSKRVHRDQRSTNAARPLFVEWLLEGRIHVPEHLERASMSVRPVRRTTCQASSNLSVVVAPTVEPHKRCASLRRRGCHPCTAHASMECGIYHAQTASPDDSLRCRDGGAVAHITQALVEDVAGAERRPQRALDRHFGHPPERQALRDHLSQRALPCSGAAKHNCDERLQHAFAQTHATRSAQRQQPKGR